MLDPSYVNDRNVYVQLALNFRFGREEDESMGYSFVKTMYLHTLQVYPPEKERPTTEIQVRGRREEHDGEMMKGLEAGNELAKREELEE